MSEIKVNSIKGVGASAAAVTVHNSDGTCTLASGSKLNNCTTDGKTNLTIADGNLVIGTSGHGIDFSATSDLGGKTSELLDDYEEGTYTPVLTGAQGNPTQSYANQYGYYIKIGRFVNVTVDIKMAASGISGGSGIVLLSIPFAQANLTNHQGISASVGYAPSWGAITPTAAYASPNDSTVYLLGNDKDTGANFVNSSQVTNGTRLIMGFSYATT